jgi:hypothetical protein
MPIRCQHAETVLISPERTFAAIDDLGLMFQAILNHAHASQF